MVSPDQRIDPNRNIDAKTQSQEVRRKPPPRDFREVAERVDERRYKEEEEAEKVKGKKRGAKGKEETEKTAPETNIFELAKGRREGGSGKGSSKKETNSIEEISEKKRSFFEMASEKQKKMSAYGGVEQSDLAALYPPPLQLQSPFTTAMAKESSPVNITSLQQIIDQIAKTVYTLEKGGTLETVIPLKGLFNGSRLVISENEFAPGQMNITIDNLTAQAQQLLELNKKFLLDELAHKSIVVHIFTASAAVEPTGVDPTLFQRDRSSSDERSGQNRDREREQEQTESE